RKADAAAARKNSFGVALKLRAGRHHTAGLRHDVRRRVCAGTPVTPPGHRAAGRLYDAAQLAVSTQLRMNFSVRPLHPLFAAEVCGVDTGRRLEGAAVRTLNEAIDRY